MSQQPPHPTHGYAPQQPAPKSKKKWLYIGLGALVFIVIIIAASSNGSKGGDGHKSVTAPSHSSQASTDQKKTSKPKTEQSPAQAFKAYVAKNGTATEQAAAKHVTKVQGGDDNNNLLDQADVYTDYSGDLMSGDASSGKLIASSFADWQKSRGKASKNGLVTVYNKSGEILSNGKY